MNAGVYEHKGHPYLLIGLCRLHDGSCVSEEVGDEFVAYVPLRTEPEWSGTARIALRTVEDFEANFEWVGDRLP
jgi:hypothetical protein